MRLLTYFAVSLTFLLVKLFFTPQLSFAICQEEFSNYGECDACTGPEKGSCDIYAISPTEFRAENISSCNGQFSSCGTNPDGSPKTCNAYCGSTAARCSSFAEAKAYCRPDPTCTGKTDCTAFSNSAARNCCTGVYNNCSQCLGFNTCAPPEIANINWQCVYANNCQDSVWATGCRDIPASNAPKCNGSLPTGTYYPGQIVNVGGEVVTKNSTDPKINTADILLGSTYVNWKGVLSSYPPSNCTPLKSTGTFAAGSYYSNKVNMAFNDSNIVVSAPTNIDMVGQCNADPYSVTGISGNCSSNTTGCSVGAATAANRPSKVNIRFNWEVPNIDQTETAWVKGSNNSGNCSYSSSFRIVPLTCSGLRVGDGARTIPTPPPGTVTKIRFTSTNPKSSYTTNVACTNGLSLTNAGFPKSYNQNYGSDTFTSYDYIDDDSRKKLPDGTNIISYSGGGWRQIPVNNDPNTDGSRHFNNHAGKTVTVYFIGESVTVYGWAWERTAKNADETVTKPEFTAKIDDADATILDSYIKSSPPTCTFRAPRGNAGRNTYAPICTILPTSSRTGIRKLTLTTANDDNLYFDGVQINTPYVMPFTIPTNVSTGRCTFTASVANNYFTDENQDITSDSCEQNFSLNITCPASAPSSPTLLLPTNDSTTLSVTPLLSWNTPSTWGQNCAGNTNTYTIYLDQNPSPTTIIGSGITTNTFTTNLLPGLTYYWKVIASNGNQTASSPVWSFRTPARPAYFQTIGGGITSLGTIKSPLPSVGEYLSKNSSKPDAGIISSPFINTLDKGLGHFSQNGTANPGWNRGAASTPRIDELTYAKLYNTVLTNAGVDSTPANIAILCNTATLPVSYFDSGSYRIFCYKNAGEIAQAVNAPTTSTSIIIPHPSYPTNNPIPGNLLVATDKKVILFITPNPFDLGSTTTLSTPATITVDPTNTTGLVTIVNGDINATSSTRLDGLYLFSGQFISGSGSNQLLGSGSLIGTGTINLTRTHGTTGAINPAELWTYQPKYLWLFRNILTQPSYSWKELPPE